MHALRFVLVGGFLGAGKTTALARLARHYRAGGRRVGLVTNDQAGDLVDTRSLQAQGFPVEEVAGACFCCKFDDLVDRVHALGERERPDVIIAEPVGSCTDLVATVVQPLRDLYRGQFCVAPYGVLFKPGHGLRILRDEPGAGFSPKAAYIFRKQLEEADAVLINRVDELSPADLGELISLLRRDYPATPVLPVSAKTGQGFDAYTALLEQEGAFGAKVLDIDYDTYAQGEAELGWLNGTAHVRSDRPFALDELLLDVVGRLRAGLAGLGAEVAHLKAIGLGGVAFGVANLVGSHAEVELSLPSRCAVVAADLIVNARVAAEPGALAARVREAVAAATEARDCRAEFGSMQSFRPGRPRPTYRYASSVP